MHNDTQDGDTYGGDTHEEYIEKSDGRLIIRLERAFNHKALDELDEELAKHHVFFQRGGQVVEIREIKEKTPYSGKHLRLPEGYLVIQPLDHIYFRYRADEFAIFKQHDGRAESWKHAAFPERLSREYLARASWKLPILTGIVETPTLRHDCTVLSKPGYDFSSGLFYAPRGVKFPPIPEQPTREDALYALKVLKRPLKDYAFSSPHHESVALSAILTACNRRAVPMAPLFAITAPKLGSGKSLLVDAISIIASGRTASVMTLGGDDTEAEKRIGGALIQGARILSFDNLERPLSGDFLNQCLTQSTVTVRPLGTSKPMELRVNSTFFATGNNLRIDGDMVRRTLLCEIDPGVERPFERDFGYDLKEYCLEHRADLAVAALTLMRAYAVSGDTVTVTPYASYPEWDLRVRRALLWLGAHDPVETVNEVIETDSVSNGLALLLEAVYQVFGKNEFTTRDVVTKANEMQRGFASEDFVNEKLHMALQEITPRGDISSKGLGQYFAKYQKRNEKGLKIVKTRKLTGYQYWRIVSSRTRSQPQEEDLF